MTCGSRTIYPEGRNKGLCSKLQHISPEGSKSVKQLKLHKYDNKDDDNSPTYVNSVRSGTECHFHVKYTDTWHRQYYENMSRKA